MALGTCYLVSTSLYCYLTARSFNLTFSVSREIRWQPMC